MSGSIAWAPPLCEAGVRLTSTELLVVLSPLGDLRRPALSRGLLLVMRPAEGSKVGLAMVITSNNVIHVGRVIRTPLTRPRRQGGTPESIAPQDALSDLTPVSRETFASIRTGPLRQRNHLLATWSQLFVNRADSYQPAHSAGPVTSGTRSNVAIHKNDPDHVMRCLRQQRYGPGVDLGVEARTKAARTKAARAIQEQCQYP